MRSALSLCALLVLGGSSANAAPLPQEYRPWILQPCVYLSPSRNAEFEVWPSNRYGHGPCEVELRREGRVLWERELDRTPLDARVLDDGVVVGYAEDDYGLRFFVFDPQGGERTCASIFQSFLVEGGRDPMPNGLVVRQEPGLATLRMTGGEDRHLSLVDGRELAFATGREVLWPAVRRARVRVTPPERRLDLVEAGSVQLEIEGGPLEASYPHFLERLGRPIVVESCQVAHGFDSEGRYLWTLRVQRYGGLRPFLGFDVDATGTLHGYLPRVDFAFDEQGRVLAELPHELRVSEHERFLPDGARWDWNRWRPVLQREGQPELELERGADGLWFRSLTLASVAADGTTVAFDEGVNPGSSSRKKPISYDGDLAGKLQVTAPDGRVRVSLTLPEDLRVHALAADPLFVALLAEPPTQLWLVSLDGAFLGQAPLPVTLKGRCALSFSPDGRELLVLDSAQVLRRFEPRWR